MIAHSLQAINFKSKCLVNLAGINIKLLKSTSHFNLKK